MAELKAEESHGGCGQWWQWWWQLRVPHGFCVPEQRAEMLCGPYVTGEVGAGGALAVTLSTHIVGFISMETTGQRLVEPSNLEDLCGPLPKLTSTSRMVTVLV